MRRFIKVLVVCFVLLLSFTGIVNADETSLPINKLPIGPRIPGPVTPLDPEDGGLIIPETIAVPSDSDMSSEVILPSPEEHKIFARWLGFNDDNNMDQRYRGETKILSYSLGAGNAQLGAANNNIIKITKRLDTASSKIMRACIRDQHIQQFELTVLKSRDPEERLLCIKLYDLEVISYNMITNHENPENTIEEIYLKFTMIDYEQTVYKEDGSPMPTKYKFRYDYKLGREL